MKAIYFEEHGGNEVLKYGEIETPTPGHDEVQVEIKAAALNRLDIFVRNGWPGIKIQYPHIPGADGAGVVSAVGRDIHHFAVGDRVVINATIHDGGCERCLEGNDHLCLNGSVLGEHHRGTFAEYIALHQRQLLKIPDDLAFEEAAAASLVFLTAWHSMITRGQLKAGESVLVVGAGGGVNLAYIQIAKLAGAGPIYVVGSTDDKLRLAESLGADVLINRNDGDWGKALYGLTGKRGVDVVVDNVGAPTWMTSIRSLRRGGRMLVVGGSAGYQAEVGVNYVFAKQVSIVGSTMGTEKDFETVMDAVFEGKLHAVIDSTRPLAEAAEAYARLEQGHVMGKLVLVP